MAGYVFAFLLGTAVYGFVALLIISYFRQKYGWTTANGEYNGYYGLMGIFYLMQAGIIMAIVVAQLIFVGWSWQIILWFMIPLVFGATGKWFLKRADYLKLASCPYSDERDEDDK